MADADLFMECEEEELEPWQQMNDDVEDEEVGIAENKTNTATLSVVSPSPSSMTIVPPVAAPVALPIVSTPLVVSSATVPSDGKKPMVSLFTSASSPVSSVLPPSLAPQGIPHSMPSLVPPGLPKPAPGQQLILTQSPAGLSTVAMSQVLQPVQMMPSPAPGPSTASNQPIFFTTQGFPVRNVRPVQNSVNPLGIVLNVQQGQTVRPITLLSAPGAQFFKPAVGVPQVMPQVMPQPVHPGNAVAPRPPTSSYTTVQIPATLTIRSTAPLTQPLTTMAATTGSQPLQSLVPPSNPAAKMVPVNVCNLVTVKHGDGNPDVQKLVNMVNTVSQPTVAQPQALQVVMANNNGPTNGLNSGPASVPPPSPLDSIKVGPATSVPSNVCPRCGAQFRMLEALRGHMCFCCPELSIKSSEGQKPTTSNSVPVPRPTLTPPMQPKPLPMLASMGPSVDSQGKLIMLVDDFYYGTCEGIRGRGSTEVREHGLFKCLSCAKRLKNNLRLMNHMKHHVELDQQNGEVDTHTNCQHCYRQFPTPFQLQCHLESVHSHYESTTKCKICEWAFESEPVFLQHMKNTHKPGEMPYVCQVCDYRSSFYNDVYNHFRTWHEDTRNLLCHYCLKVFKNSSAYQQHYIRHQKKTVYHCNKCRLQFLFTKDKIDHKMNHHKTFRKPKQLEGLMPGTKVTIRAYAAQNKATMQPPVAPPVVSPGVVPAPTGRDTHSPHMGRVVPKPLQTLSQSQNKQQITTKKRSVSKMLELLTKFQEQRETLGKQLCLECNFEVPDFPNHYPTYVHCSLCHYGTCCSRAYANHMIINHVPRSSHRYLTMYKNVTPSGGRLTCASCKFFSWMGDEMAKHLVQNPSHSYSLCTQIVPAKVGFTTKRQVLSPVKNSPSQPSEQLPASTPTLASSPKWEPDEMLDQEMAPVEDIETDTEEEQEECPVVEQEAQGTDIKDEIACLDDSKMSTSAADDLAGAKEREETLSVRQLRIVLFALCCGIAQAAEHFSTQTSLIHTWLQEKERQLDRERRGGGGEAMDRLVEWVLSQREQQLPVNEKNLFQKASEIHSHANQGSSFRISYEWAVRFMLQHDLGLQTKCAVSQSLPRSMEESAQAFTEFVHKQIQAQTISPSVIGAMDELSIFVDLDLLADPATVGKESAFQLVGTGESLIDICLATLADGTLLPTMVFFKGQLPGRLRAGVPSSILLEAKVEGFTEEEEMDLWMSQVWQKHMKSQGGGKGLLIMDAFRGHVTDESLASLSAASTLPTIVPAGCTSRLQPLEMCLRPVLQRFLLTRWTKLAAQGGAAGASPKELVQLLVAWLVEALAPLSEKPELLQRSFRVASVLSESGSHNTQEEAQKELTNTFSEILLGPDVAELVTPAEESIVTTEEEVEKQVNSTDEKRTLEEMVEAKEDEKENDTEVKEAEKQLNDQEVEKMNILDPAQQGNV